MTQSNDEQEEKRGKQFFEELDEDLEVRASDKEVMLHFNTLKNLGDNAIKIINAEEPGFSLSSLLFWVQNKEKKEKVSVCSSFMSLFSKPTTPEASLETCNKFLHLLDHQLDKNKKTLDKMEDSRSPLYSTSELENYERYHIVLLNKLITDLKDNAEKTFGLDGFYTKHYKKMTDLIEGLSPKSP